jgi:hypothetical protein
MNAVLSTTPAFLIVGTPETTKPHALSLVHTTLCTAEKCTGASCQHTTSPLAHHQGVWICPEKKYTLDILEPIAHKMSFTLDPEHHFFFILEKAELLTPVCANSLLKLVEEPPPGYHFIFLAAQSHLVIPTIRSRCHILYTSPAPRTLSSGFLRHFMDYTHSPSAFLKDLQTECPEDFETPECLDLLIKHWFDQHKNSLVAQDSASAHQTHALLTLFQQATQQPPMPGSAKIFWRNLFLQKGAFL